MLRFVFQLIQIIINLLVFMISSRAHNYEFLISCLAVKKICICRHCVRVCILIYCSAI